MGLRSAVVGVVLALVAWPSIAAAEILWRGGFEPGDLSEWNEFTGPVDARVTIVEDPVRDGMYAARVEIRPGDLGNGGLNRVELGYHPPGEGFAGSERYYAWSMLVPADVPTADGWHLVTYWEAEVLYTNAMSFRLYTDDLFNFATFVGGEQVHWSTTLEHGVWHDFVLHVVWSPDPAVGLVELWYDDQLVVPATNVATMHTGGDGIARPNFLHQGVLRWDQIAQTEVVYFDGTLEATALADVMGGPGGTTTGAGETTGSTGGTGDGETTGAATTTTSDGGTDVGDTTTTSTTDATTTTGTIDPSTDTSGAAIEDDGGCGCTSSDRSAVGGLALALLVGIAGRRSRARGPARKRPSVGGAPTRARNALPL